MAQRQPTLVAGTHVYRTVSFFPATISPPATISECAACAVYKRQQCASEAVLENERRRSKDLSDRLAKEQDRSRFYCQGLEKEKEISAALQKELAGVRTQKQTELKEEMVKKGFSVEIRMLSGNTARVQSLLPSDTIEMLLYRSSVVLNIPIEYMILAKELHTFSLQDPASLKMSLSDLGITEDVPLTAIRRAGPSDGADDLLAEFREGQRVQYWSETYRMWMEAIVQRVQAPAGAAPVYDLDVKRGAKRNRLRNSAPPLGGA